MIHDPDQPTEYGLVMPFVTVASKGGPYADDAYAAGWAMGVLDERLSAPWLQQHTDTVLADDVEQAELVAMRRGFATERRESGVEGWVFMSFIRTGDGV